MARLFARLDPSVPAIHFGTDTGSLLELQRDAGGSVIGLDWRVELDRAWRRLGDGVAVQGNLDPTILLLAPRGRSPARRGGSWPRPPDGPAISSTWGTASSRPRPSITSVALVNFVHDAAGERSVRASGWMKPTPTGNGPGIPPGLAHPPRSAFYLLG